MYMTSIKTTLYTFLGFCFLVTYIWVLALSDGQKKIILENFQQQQYELLFESDIELLDGNDTTILDISRKLNIYDSAASKLSTQREEIEQKKAQITGIVHSLEETIANIQQDIDIANQNIKDANNQIVLTKKQIEDIQTQTQDLQQRIHESREVLLEYMTYIYKKSNTLSDNQSLDNLKSILLDHKDIAHIVDDLYYKSLVQVAGHSIIQEYRWLVKDLYTQQVSLEKNQQSLKILRKSEIIEKSILQDRQSLKQRLLDASKWRQSEYEKFIQSKIKLERNINTQAIQQKIKFRNLQQQLLEKHGCEFVDISINSVQLRTMSEKCLNLNKIIYSETQLTQLSHGDETIFSWPVIPSQWISAYFRDESYKNEFGADHNAIDIITTQGTPVRAAMSGYVIHVEPPVDDGYSFVAIKHPDGFVSIYGHLSQIGIQQFDFVKKWHVFAVSGWEYGTPWAGYLTTGPHLHFELFQNKQYVDPLNFLDISILPFDKISTKYKYKYYEDFEKRKWYKYQETQDNTKPRFNIVWDTEIQRQKYLLNIYARSDFRNWDMWVWESLDGNIDPTFVMCIWLAESWLGVNLKTSYNVWNVWNTDSWSTSAYPNPRSWIYAIIKTLNNRFLNKYDTINKLSCYGNSKAKLCNRKNPPWEYVYASSPDHWHNNIIKCMSHVKWVYIPDNYRFRLD